MKNNLCTARKSYEQYKNKHENPLEQKQYLEILYGFFDYMIEQLLESKEISIPCKLGSLQIIGKKRQARLVDGEIKGLSPDWKETKKLWESCKECKEKKQLVYHFNEHTNSVRYKFFWSKKNVLIKNKGIYYFKPARGLKRNLAKLIKQGKEFLVT